MTSTIIAIAITCLLLMFGIAISITLILLIRKKNKPDYICTTGMSIYIDKSLRNKINWAAFEKVIALYIDGMSPNPFEELKLEAHIRLIKCYLRDHRLEAKIRGENKTYTGLTHSMYKIEVACDPYFWNEEGKIKIHKITLDYELNNACIMGLEKDGYYVAIAEKDIDPEKSDYWDWFKDIDDDGDQDSDDIEIWKKRREIIDEQYKLVKARINKEVGSMI